MSTSTNHNGKRDLVNAVKATSCWPVCESTKLLLIMSGLRVSASEVMENNLRHRRIVLDGVVMGLRHWFRKTDDWTVVASTDDRAVIHVHCYHTYDVKHLAFINVLIWTIYASSCVKKCKQTFCCVSFNVKLVFRQ